MTETMRLFVGLRVPASQDMRTALGRLSEIGSSLKTVSPQDLHVTLKFLGETSDSRIPDICRHLKRVGDEFKSLDLQFRGVGCFPTCKRPSVIWIGLDESPEADCSTLTRLAHRIDTEMSEVGFHPETRKYRAHLTLARLRDRPHRSIRDFISRHRTTEFGQITVAEVHLIQSKLDRQGTRYVDIASFPLGLARSPSGLTAGSN